MTREISSIVGVDGNDIGLHIYRSELVVTPAPAVIYLHGGGMAVQRVDEKPCRYWYEDLARAGLVVVAVDFRNSGGAADVTRFPRG